MFSYKEQAGKGSCQYSFFFPFFFFFKVNTGVNQFHLFMSGNFFIIFLVSMGGLGFHISGLGHFFYSSLVISFIGDMVFIWLYERGLFFTIG